MSVEPRHIKDSLLFRYYDLVSDFTFKNDKYKRSRGGFSKLLDIRCRKCRQEICLYQKDGHGALYRLYIDRIFNSTIPLNNKSISCHNGHILAMKILYQKENRIAFRLFTDSIIKKVIKNQ